MKNRLSRLSNEERALRYACSRPRLFPGTDYGASHLGKTVNPLLPYADALMITRGALRNWIDPSADVPIYFACPVGRAYF